MFFYGAQSPWHHKIMVLPGAVVWMPECVGGAEKAEVVIIAGRENNRLIDRSGGNQASRCLSAFDFCSTFILSHCSKAFLLFSSNSNNDFVFVQIFQGNVDNNTHRKNVFEPPFYARYVRVVPWEWHERITLRMELLGCDD